MAYLNDLCTCTAFHDIPEIYYKQALLVVRHGAQRRAVSGHALQAPGRESSAVGWALAREPVARLPEFVFSPGAILFRSWRF